MDDATRDWLLDSDPALRWQVERDIVGEPEHVWQATRSRIATEGFGAELLALQDDDGQWAGGAYFPGREDPRMLPGAPASDDGPPPQPWTATTWTLTTLREWGLDAAALDGTATLLDRNSRWEYDDLPYWGGEVDACINGMTLANGAWLGADVSALANWFREHRMADGGWNCEWVEGATVSSFHSTLNTVRGMLAYQDLTGDDALADLRHGGEEYLLERRLTRRKRDGELVGPWVDWFAYPFRWAYSGIRALDHFRSASILDGTAPDPRAAAAIDIVRSARNDDGTWTQQGVLPGAVWFEVDAPEGAPSRWLTMFGTRVLSWWDSGLEASKTR
jgi:hypothetical protein